MKFTLAFLGLSLMAAPTFAACYEGEIETFFPRFAAEIAVQEAVAADVVMVSSMDPDAQPEPRAVVLQLRRAEIEWPVVPNATLFERAGGIIGYADTVPEALPAGKVVTLRGDNGYLMRLTFTQDPCWRLSAITDDSL